jgi:hypothetical protein
MSGSACARTPAREGRVDSASPGLLLQALAEGWKAIRARHEELPPVILVIGPGPLPAATRIELGHFAPMRWSPWRDSHLSVRADRLKAFTTAIQEGDQAGAMQALAASSDTLLREARQLSADASAVMSEVLITVDGVAGSAAEIFATLLHEAVHAVAFERGIKDTSRQGRYHNARFRAVAEELGLETVRDAPLGWSSTALAPGTSALYRETLRALTEALGDHREHSTALGPSSRVRGDPRVRLRPPRPAGSSSKHPRGDLHPLQ